MSVPSGLRGALAENSAVMVAAPATPSADMPAAVWNSLTAALVAAPNVPSAVPVR